MHDVAIIGGGLAGLALSVELSSKGYDVVLFEKNTYPFHKVCGEYIPNESVAYLNHLGANLNALGAANINQFALSTLHGNKMSSTLPLGGIGISRYTLDNELANISKTRGAKIFDNTTVLSTEKSKLATTAGDFEARIIIGAHGKRSTIDKKLNRPFIQKPLSSKDNFIGVKYHVHADLPRNLIELHIFKNGYCGISAIEDNKYCMCYLSKASNLESNMTIDELEASVLSQNPILKDYLTRFEKVYDHPKVISQIYFQNKEKGNDTLIYAGDAAGLIAPLSGNGMSMALHSAHLLQNEISQFLDGQQNENTTLINYSNLWKKAFNLRFRFSKVMQMAFFNPNFMNGLVISANILTPLASTIIKQTHEKAFFKG